MGQAKWYTRTYCNYSIVGLMRAMVPALDSVDVDLIRNYFRKARRYIRTYREGNTTGQGIEEAVKKYKSHRRVQRNK